MEQPVICVVGLGYVGLPLAHAFAKAGLKTHGYDINTERIEELKQHKDRTDELTSKQLQEVSIEFSDDPKVITEANIIILAIPTPVDEEKKPDLTLLKAATETVAEHIQDGAIVVYESTVYPGVTEDTCGPILKEKKRNIKLGYSPERVNPGDKEHTIDKIVKIVAGEDPETTKTLAELYGRIAPVHIAPNIKVAEMAKAIENAQRDLNIAYINDIAMLCNSLEISTKDVLEAAGTKWNFLQFQPGLVGGHCIGVDPYYLLAVGKEKHFPSKMITSARAINDGMASHVAGKVINKLTKPQGSSVLVLGLTFKENVPDTRNSKAQDVVKALEIEGCTVTTHDPHVNSNGALKEESAYDAILLLVPHKEYLQMTPQDFAKLGKTHCIFYDLKSLYDPKEIEKAGLTYLAL